MILLALLLLLDATLHAVLVYRFGTRGNEPFLVFAVVYLALAIAAFLAVPYVLWAVLVLSAIGIVGLTATFGKPQRDKTLDRIIWVVDLAIIVLVAYLLFVQEAPAVAA